MLKFLPLILFAAMAGFLFKGLYLDPSKVPSPLIDKPAPAFSLPLLASSDQTFATSDLIGKVWVLNVWASWCAACVTEHPNFVALVQQRDIPLVGLNYKDTPDQAQAWLARFGNPYAFALDDREGAVGLDWGVYAVPETFVIDKKGKIRKKFIGVVSSSLMSDTLIPLIDELSKEAS